MTDWSIAQSELLFFLYRSLDSQRAYASVAAAASHQGLANYERVLIEELKAKHLIRGDQRTEFAGILSSMVGSTNSYVLTPTGFDDIERELSTPGSHASKLQNGTINATYFRHLLGDTKRELNEKVVGRLTIENEVIQRDVIELDRESEAFIHVSQAFDNLEREISESNEAFAEEPEARAAALAEVRSLRSVWQATSIRFESFRVQAQGALQWISEKSASAVIGELCKHILKALIGWS